MKMKQKQKEKDLVPILQDNKRLAELLLKVEEEITETEKKMNYYAMKKGSNVGVDVNFKNEFTVALCVLLFVATTALIWDTFIYRMPPKRSRKRS